MKHLGLVFKSMHNHLLPQHAFKNIGLPVLKKIER